MKKNRVEEIYNQLTYQQKELYHKEYKKFNKKMAWLFGLRIFLGTPVLMLFALLFPTEKLMLYWVFLLLGLQIIHLIPFTYFCIVLYNLEQQKKYNYKKMVSVLGEKGWSKIKEKTGNNSNKQPCANSSTQGTRTHVSINTKTKNSAAPVVNSTNLYSSPKIESTATNVKPTITGSKSKTNDAIGSTPSTKADDTQNRESEKKVADNLINSLQTITNTKNESEKTTIKTSQKIDPNAPTVAQFQSCSIIIIAINYINEILLDIEKSKNSTEYKKLTKIISNFAEFEIKDILSLEPLTIPIISNQLDTAFILEQITNKSTNVFILN